MCSMKCSTPTRRVHGCDLPTIPNELYFEIFYHLSAADEGPSELECKRIYSKLTKVCQLFRAELLPRIFESMELTIPLPDDPTLPVFWKALHTNREPTRYLVPYIKVLSVIGPTGLPASTATYSLAISRLLYLESISFTSVAINGMVIQALGSMKNLKKLFIRECAFDSDLPGISCATQPLELTHFELFNTIPVALIPAFVSPSLQVFKTDNWNLADFFMCQTMEWHLQELSVPLSIVNSPILGVFLNNTPSIRTLSLSKFRDKHHTHDSNVAILPLQLSSLPRLETVQCPSFLLPELIPGRPVKHIDLSTDIGVSGLLTHRSFKPSEVASLKQSAVVIEALRIPWYLLRDLLVNEHFPCLHTLTIDDAGLRPTHGIEILRPLQFVMPSIRNLSLNLKMFSGHSLDLHFQHNIIVTSLESMIPSICRVQLSEKVYWRRTDHWWPVVPLRFREDLRKKLQRIPVHGIIYEHITDFGGLLASLFRPDEPLFKLNLFGTKTDDI